MRKLALGLTLAAAVPTLALAKRMIEPFDRPRVAFELQGSPLGGSKVAAETPAYLTASRIAATPIGAVVIDGDSGALIKTDKAGKNIGEVAIGREAGLLAYDPALQVAYVADRRGDRVAVVKLIGKPEITASWKTPAEPYAVALAPDKKTVLVTTIADRTLVAFDVATGKEKWRTPLGREPRGLAISPDGTRALVAYLTTGTVDQIDLLETHRAEHIAIATASTPRRGRRASTDQGESFARASFAVTFLGERQALVPFQRETPVQRIDGGERTGSYGGGFEPPVSHQLAFLGFGKGHTNQVTASIIPHQPRAMAWDRAHDALYIAGMGSDSILQVKNASQVTIAVGGVTSTTVDRKQCGPDGLAVGSDGDLFVWCSFTRSVQRIDFTSRDNAIANTGTIVSTGPTLIASAWSEKEHQGMVLFHSATPAISQQGAMACATCHPDNRADGLSWRIDKHELQTPLLAGRMVGTHPFKWDGGDATLKDSLTGTMKRLGGFGLDAAQTAALTAYVEALPTVRTPTRDTEAVARGKKLFDTEAGCRTCHDGAKYTDQDKHKFTGTLAQSDTPSLLGLAASAPYYHDGSAATLEALLRDRGAVHGMTDTAKLSDKEVTDLVAFLETL
ncbi:MAG: c-type cytochrome [Kofleriaceae bacterium]